MPINVGAAEGNANHGNGCEAAPSEASATPQAFGESITVEAAIVL